MFKGKKPIAKVPNVAIVSPEIKRTQAEMKQLDAEYKKSEHYKKRKAK